MKHDPGWRGLAVARLKDRLAVFSPRPPLMASTFPVFWSMTTTEACGCGVMSMRSTTVSSSVMPSVDLYSLTAA